MASPQPDPLRTAAGLIALLLFVTHAFFVSPPSWNENSRFDLTRSIVERQRLDIDPYAHNTGDKSFRDGHYFSDKAPGSALLAVLPYAAYYAFLRASGGGLPVSVQRDATAEPLAAAVEEDTDYYVNLTFRRALYICSLATSGLFGALLGAAFFAYLVRRRGLGGRRAFLGALALSVGSLVLPYATMFYGHVPAAAFLFGSFLLVGGKKVGEGGACRALAGAGALAGAAVLTELPAAGAAFILLVYAAVRTRSVRGSLWFVLGAAGPALVLLAYQTAAFGNPFRPGYAHLSRPEFAEGMSAGVFGVGLPRLEVLFAMLVGRARGLLYVSPVLALAFVGFVPLLAARARDGVDRAGDRVAAAIVLFFVTMNAGYYMWHGGSALGPRHVIPALPFLCIGFVPVLSRSRVALFAVLATVSVVNQLAATAVEPAAPLVRDVLLDHVYHHLSRGEIGVAAGATNLGALFGLSGPLSLAPLLLIWALALPILLPLLPTVGAAAIIPPEESGGDQHSDPRNTP